MNSIIYIYIYISSNHRLIEQKENLDLQNMVEEDIRTNQSEFKARRLI